MKNTLKIFVVGIAIICANSYAMKRQFLPIPLAPLNPDLLTITQPKPPQPSIIYALPPNVPPPTPKAQRASHLPTTQGQFYGLKQFVTWKNIGQMPSPPKPPPSPQPLNVSRHISRSRFTPEFYTDQKLPVPKELLQPTAPPSLPLDPAVAVVAPLAISPVMSPSWTVHQLELENAPPPGFVSRSFVPSPFSPPASPSFKRTYDTTKRAPILTPASSLALAEAPPNPLALNLPPSPPVIPPS